MSKRGQQRVVFLIDVHLTSFFVGLFEIAVPGVAATCNVSDQLQEGHHKMVRHLIFSRRECEQCRLHQLAPDFFV